MLHEVWHNGFICGVNAQVVIHPERGRLPYKTGEITSVMSIQRDKTIDALIESAAVHGSKL